MLHNVLALLEANDRAGRPVNIVIALRPDRPLNDVMAYPDIKLIAAYEPEIDFVWAYTSAGGRITRDQLPDAMRLRSSPRKSEACVELYNGPIVLPSGEDLACSCVAAMDALKDLKIGDINAASIGDIWRSDQMSKLRAQFSANSLNPTCAGCEMHRTLEFYRTPEGRTRAEINRARAAGQSVKRENISGRWQGS